MPAVAALRRTCPTVAGVYRGATAGAAKKRPSPLLRIRALDTPSAARRRALPSGNAFPEPRSTRQIRICEPRGRGRLNRPAACTYIVRCKRCSGQKNRRVYPEYRLSAAVTPARLTGNTPAACSTVPLYLSLRLPVASSSAEAGERSEPACAERGGMVSIPACARMTRGQDDNAPGRGSGFPLARE